MRKKTPRLASTYRATRRNASRGTTWPGVEATYRPYLIKPPVAILQHVDPITNKPPPAPIRVGWRERPQPKLYAPNGKREAARRLRQQATL